MRVHHQYTIYRPKISQEIEVSKFPTAENHQPSSSVVDVMDKARYTYDRLA